jgi:hypothetical protein
MPLAARVLALAAFAAVVAGCDHGGAFIAENNVDQELIARVTGTEQSNSLSTLSFRPRQDVLVLPALSRVAIAVLHFADPFHIDKIEILALDCAPVAIFAQAEGVAFGRDGQVIVIDPGPAAKLRHEFPSTGNLAKTTDRCRDVSNQ